MSAADSIWLSKSKEIARHISINMNLYSEAQTSKSEIALSATLNGATANGATANGATANGATANGATANGATANSATANGATANGATANGATANTVEKATGSKSKKKRTKRAKRGKSSLVHDYIFVLWGPQFDEVAATIFVTELREAGLRVKVVSLVREKMKGMNGVALFADFGLEKAFRLAQKAVSVIVPSGLGGMKTLDNAPFFEFFQQAHNNNAQFFISDNVDESELKKLNIFPPSIEKFTLYPEHQELMEFVRQVPHWLPYVV
ncbi:MAG: DJ-1/PfpI family protein [Ardenticatenaceae bacterium]